VEYAILTSALALMLTGTDGAVRDLPQSVAKAQVAAAQAARRVGVPATGARRAVTTAPAPHRRPALRYLYALGWVAAQKDKVTCAFVRVSGGDVRSVARREFRRVKGMAAALRRAKVTEAQAVNAFDAGFRAGCVAQTA